MLNQIDSHTEEYLGNGVSRETFIGSSESYLKEYAIKMVRSLVFWELLSIKSKFLPGRQTWKVAVIYGRPSQMATYSHKPLFWRGGR